MGKTPDFDVLAAHRFFSAHCFNQAWEFIDKADRNLDDTDRMLDAAHASAWHWRQRPDCTNQNLSIGYWQLSRVYALAGEARRSARYAQLCLEVSGEEPPFFMGYAYEALARAAALAGERGVAGNYLMQARAFLAKVEDREEQEQLEKDLDSLIS